MERPAGPDAELVARVRDGDLDAFERLVARHRVRVSDLAREIVHDHDAAQDVVQEALVRAFCGLLALIQPTILQRLDPPVDAGSGHTQGTPEASLWDLEVLHQPEDSQAFRWRIWPPGPLASQPPLEDRDVSVSRLQRILQHHHPGIQFGKSARCCVGGSLPKRQPPQSGCPACANE
jgi:hypothetical protein